VTERVAEIALGEPRHVAAVLGEKRLVEPDVRYFLRDRLGRQTVRLLAEQDQDGIAGHEARQPEVCRRRHQEDEDVLRQPDGEPPKDPVPAVATTATPFGHGAGGHIGGHIARGRHRPTSER
jgi:hypothetical protein